MARVAKYRNSEAKAFSYQDHAKKWPVKVN